MDPIIKEKKFIYSHSESSLLTRETAMYTTVYILVPAYPEMDANQAQETAQEIFIEKVVPFTAYTHTQPHPMDQTQLDSKQGTVYIDDALGRTIQATKEYIETLYDFFSHRDQLEEGEEETADHNNESITALLNNRNIRRAASHVGETAGKATFLYTQHGKGIRTREELDIHLESNEVHTGDSDEYLVVVPLRAHH